jgi:methyl coenzyme M reductase subunit C
MNEVRVSELTYIVAINYEPTTRGVTKPVWKQINVSESFKTPVAEITCKIRNKTNLMTDIIYLKCAGWTAFGLGMTQ